ncbi:MAG: DUF2326 domain-containing protein [Thalassolituus sp.]
MFLKSLTVYNKKNLIRSITFNKGINLVVDYTPKDALKTSSGNSVGKTTVLRLIDFCLDGSIEKIITDSEFKIKNTTIENFLTKNNIIVTLTLVDSLDTKKPREIKIERNFLKRSEKIQKINGEKCTNEEFSKKLKSLIFNTDSEKPTFKQLKSKNIRDEKNKLTNTIKVLSPYDTDVAYETLHLFWFGVDIDLSKDKLVKDKNIEERIQAKMRKESTLPQINQSLIVIEKEIKELVIKKESFNLNEKYEQDLKILNEIKYSINSCSVNISRLELRRDLIEESKVELEDKVSAINIEEIRQIYSRASKLIPNIQRTFEETLDFHNTMILGKVAFITEELPELKNQIIQDKQKLKSLLKSESIISEKLNKSGAIEDLQKIIDLLNMCYERKGNLEEQQRSWIVSNEVLEVTNNEIQKMNSATYSKDELIQSKITKFNEYFSEISKQLDGVSSVLSADIQDGVYKFIVTSLDSNLGTGAKKSQMASFDLAYIRFADENSIPCLHFILQDQIENVHSNQITNLFTEIVGQINCQYVLPVLSDKLPSDLDVTELQVLKLAQDDKFFRV